MTTALHHALCLTLAVLPGLASCDGPPGAREGDVCDLAADFATCPECADGETTCSFAGTSATRVSCQECQARGALYQELCEAGVTDSAATVEDGTRCTTLPAF